MTQEEKQLLLKDLCARLPYEVICKIIKSDNPFIRDNKLDAFWLAKVMSPWYDIKPYLRPMSSMTEEEELKLDDMEFEIAHLKFTTYAHECMILDYLYSRHLDVRGLIPMGLALEAPKDMYKI